MRSLPFPPPPLSSFLPIMRISRWSILLPYSPSAVPFSATYTIGPGKHPDLTPPIRACLFRTDWNPTSRTMNFTSKRAVLRELYYIREIAHPRKCKIHCIPRSRKSFEICESLTKYFRFPRILWNFLSSFDSKKIYIRIIMNSSSNLFKKTN